MPLIYKPESDLNHNVVSPEHRYSCFDKPSSRVTQIYVQDGWIGRVKRFLRLHRTEWIDNGCGHSYRGTDPSCTNCKWRDA